MIFANQHNLVRCGECYALYDRTASMTRFIMFCLANNVEIGTLKPFNRKYPRCQVSASIRIHPSLFEAFEKETGGTLRDPTVIKLN